MPFPLGPDSRITRRSDYSRIYKEGAKFPGKYLLLFALKAENLKVGITVSGKVGIAVERNRAKRRIREALKTELGACATPAELVFVARAGIKGASFDAIKSDMKKLLSKVN